MLCLIKNLSLYGGKEMKYILCGGIIVGFGYIGLCVRSHLNKREALYRSVITFIDQFIVNVNFLQVNFIECLNKECTKGGELSEIFKYYKQKFIDRMEVNRFKSVILTESEALEIFDCLNSIGTTDAENQIALLQGYKIKFAEKLATCTEYTNKYSSLAVKMSVIVGCLIVLIFV